MMRRGASSSNYPKIHVGDFDNRRSFARITYVDTTVWGQRNLVRPTTRRAACDAIYGIRNWRQQFEMEFTRT